MRNMLEIAGELDSLRDKRNCIECEGALDVLDVQVLVIDGLMMRQDVYETWHEDNELRMAAMEAVRWLWEDDQAPSESWEEGEYLAVA